MALPGLLELLAIAVFASTLGWLLMWPVARYAPRLRSKSAFPDLVLYGSAEQARLQLQNCEKHLYMLVYAANTFIVFFLILWLFAKSGIDGWIAYLLFIFACLLSAVWGVFVVLRLRSWRELRFAVRADAVIGAALARLALQNHRVFHGVSVGEVRIDHVVVGPRGVFAVKVVAHRPLKGSKTVRLSDRKLAFDDGVRLPDPLVEVERSARLLREIVTRVSRHRLTVRPVLAAPGWNVATKNDDELLLVNEKNVVMLLGWSRPADYMMEEDIPELQERLVRLCINRGL